MATRYVLFTDVTDAELDNTPIQDGQVVFSYPSGRLFLDEGNSRFTMGGREADDALSRVSENPVQNKVITNNIINTLTEAKAITKNDVFASTKVIKELAANSANIEDMTQEEYNQLSTEQKYDGTIRNITDVEVEYQYAGGVDYSNETSGLDAINVQDAIDEINNNLANNICMNLIPFPYLNGTRTENGITFTVNDDGTIVVNGTATADTYFNIDGRTDALNITEEGQTYTLSGCPKGGSNSTYRIRYSEFDSDKQTTLYQCTDYGEGVTFTSKSHAYTGIFMFVAKGQTVSNLVFKPMLEIGSVAHEYVQPISEPKSRINEVVASLNSKLANSMKHAQLLCSTASTSTVTLNTSKPLDSFACIYFEMVNSNNAIASGFVPIGIFKLGHKSYASFSDNSSTNKFACGIKYVSNNSVLGFTSDKNYELRVYGIN